MLSREYFQHYKQNLSIAFPVALSQLGHVSVAVADTMMAGQLGGIPLASATLANNIFMPMLLLGIGISIGITPMVSKANGEGDTRSIAGSLKHGIVINVVAGILIFAILFLLAPFLSRLNQPSEVIEDAISYFRIISVSIIPLMVFQVFRQFAEGLFITKEAMYISISTNILNIVLGLLFIHGGLGLPALGLNGIAVATLIARTLMALCMAIFVLRSKKFTVYINGYFQIPYSKSLFGKMLTLSLPIGLQLVFEAGAFSFAAIMAGWIGAVELAAHQIALNMAAVTYMCATGIAAAATARVGNESGTGNYGRLKKAGLSSFYMVLLFMGFCAIFFITFRMILPTFFIEDPEIISIASSLLLIAAFFQLSDGLQVTGLGALRGLKDVKVPTGIALLSYWMIGLPLGYLMAFPLKLGVIGIWYGLLTGLTTASALLVFRFIKRADDLIDGQ